MGCLRFAAQGASRSSSQGPSALEKEVKEFSSRPNGPTVPEGKTHAAIIGYQVNEIGCVAVRSGGWHDHVHFVCGLSRTVTIAALVEHVKVETSRWAKQAANGVATFSWQSGYGAFSVSQSNLPSVVDYVNHQEAHHRQRTFQDEFRELCRRHELEIDERYVWD